MEDISIIRNIKYYNNVYKNIITVEMIKAGFSDELDLIQQLNTTSDINFLVIIIKNYFVTKIINGKSIQYNKKKCEISIAAILYYYYHIVLIETHYNQYLETIYIKSFFYDYFHKYKPYYLFISICNDLIKSDDIADSTVRKKFICLNNEEFA
jgi:hypothetical protein